MRRAVFLDRDGVINRAIVRDGKLYPPASLAELEILPGVRAALDRLRAAGWACVVVTNQPDVARGTQSREVVEAINGRLAAALPIDEVRVCYHDDDDRCGCRKPQPGLLTRAPEYDVPASVMVGEPASAPPSWWNLAAPSRAKCRPMCASLRWSRLFARSWILHRWEHDDDRGTGSDVSR